MVKLGDLTSEVCLTNIKWYYEIYKKSNYTFFTNLCLFKSWILKNLSKPHDATRGKDGWHWTHRILPANPLKTCTSSFLRKSIKPILPLLVPTITWFSLCASERDIKGYRSNSISITGRFWALGSYNRI